MILDGKTVERMPVRDLARRRRARMVDSSRVGILSTVSVERGSLVSARMRSGDGGWSWSCGMEEAIRDQRAPGRYMVPVCEL